MREFKPFADSTASLEAHGVTMENGTERVTVYGDISITRDQDGLAKVRMLLGVLQAAEHALAADTALPLKVAAEPRPEDAPTAPNPFA